MKKSEKRENHSFAEFVVGVCMIVAAIVILLMNIHVNSFGFYRFGRVSSAPVLIIAFVLLMVWAVVRGRLLQWILVAADVLAIIVSVILGTQLYFSRMSVFTLLVMLALLAVGIGLALKNVAVLKGR